MDCLKNCSEHVYFGAKDCICGSFALSRILFSRNKGKNQQWIPQSSSTASNNEPKTIFQVFMKCLVFGTFIGLSIFLYPLIVTRFSDFLTSYFCPGEEFVWLPQITSSLFWVTWKMPMFVIGRILTFIWYQNIANLTCQDIRLKRRVTQTFGVSIGEQSLSLCVQTLFLGQAIIILQVACMNEGIIYYLGYCIFIFHLALLYSLYAFEYKWLQKGWSMCKRTAVVESKWPYFIGFGLPLAVLTSCFEPYVGGMCFFTIFFPITVIASTVTNERFGNFNMPCLRVFYLATFIADKILCCCLNYIFSCFKVS